MKGSPLARKRRTDEPTDERERSLPPRHEEVDESRKTNPPEFTVRFPEHGSRFDQDAEWCYVETPEGERRIRFHDYEEIFAIPGLYEYLFHEKLECRSPNVVVELIGEVLAKQSLPPGGLTVLDVGAGNGMVGEELVRLGVDSVVGVDIIPGAAAAAERDRPGVYADYRVVDLTALPAEEERRLDAAGFTAMTTVAALGFGDIPPAAFARAYNFVAPGGLVAFNIRDRFVSDRDSSGFSRLIHRMVEADVMEQLAEREYRHRLSISGTPLHYLAFVAEKHSDIPASWVADPG